MKHSCATASSLFAQESTVPKSEQTAEPPKKTTSSDGFAVPSLPSRTVQTTGSSGSDCGSSRSMASSSGSAVSAAVGKGDKDGGTEVGECTEKNLQRKETDEGSLPGAWKAVLDEGAGYSRFLINCLL